MRNSEIHSLFEKLERSRIVAARESVARLRSEPRTSDPRRLEHFGYRAYSQNDEDGIIAEIFARIGTTDRRFVEIGVGNGLENNTAYLLAQGWTGGWVEAGRNNAKHVRRTLAAPLRARHLRFRETFVTRENVDDVIRSLDLDGDLDLASIDIDGNDYYIFERLSAVRPRVVAIEYNATFRPPVSWVQAYDPRHVWDGSNASGASLTALTTLANRRGYALVGCNITGVNAFYVRRDLVDDAFCSPAETAAFYREPAYELADAFRSGHRPGWHDGATGADERI
ncbi:MAG: hypothetical protein NVS4B5_18320 [Vulcanimicrobiaceae bacterium]